MTGERGVVARVVVDQRDAVFIEPVVEFLVDGVQRDYAVVGQPEGQLEEEVRVSEERFVNSKGRFWRVEHSGGSLAIACRCRGGAASGPQIVAAMLRRR